jgi:multidrug efflux pump subunit AcrA (membrane-fusion protein)
LVLWLVLFLLPLASCRRQPPVPQRPPPPVTVAMAVARDAPMYRDEIGHTTASEVVNLQSQVAGQIMERRFADGEQLARGQVLFIFDPRP